MSDSAADRAARRHDWQVRVFRRGEEPGDDLWPVTTPEQRIAMVWELTAWTWELSGRSLPTYSRAQTPVSVVRRA